MMYLEVNRRWLFPIYRVFSLITIVPTSSRTTSAVPGPSKGVNKAYLEQALGSILQKRGFSAVYSDQCFLHLDELRRSCDNYNSTFAKRDCLVSCGKHTFGQFNSCACKTKLHLILCSISRFFENRQRV